MNRKRVSWRLERASYIALWLGVPEDIVCDRVGVSRATAYRWAKAARNDSDSGLLYALLWRLAIRLADKEEEDMSRWMMNQRPKNSDEAKARGMEGRKLTKEELEAAAADMGLAIYEPAPWDRGEPRRRRKKNIESNE